MTCGGAIGVITGRNGSGAEPTTPHELNATRHFLPSLRVRALSHFLKKLGEENQAMKATRYAFQELLDGGKTGEREVVRWIRELDTPREVAMTDSVYATSAAPSSTN